MTKITGDTLIGELLDINPQAESVLLGLGMHCLGCPASRAETLSEACDIHGVDLDELIKKFA